MPTILSSRERLLCAMRHEEPDHVPLWNLWRMKEPPFTYRTQTERAQAVIGLGMDDTLLLEPPLGKTEYYDVNRVPGIGIDVRKVVREGERYPLLIKEYQTPAGNIRQVVRQTEDWANGEDVRLFSDYNVPRSAEFIIKGPADLPSLRHLLREPTKTQLDEFRAEASELRKDAQRLGVLLEGGWTALGDALVWLVGMEAVLYLQMDQPEFLEELLDLVCEWELRRMELLLAEGVEVMVHSAWYENTDFWTPGNYRRLLKPHLARMAHLAHQAGARWNYIITNSWAPLMDDLLEIGVDSILGVDSVQGKANLQEVKAWAAGRICLWGSVNAPVTLAQGSHEEIREATAQAIRTLGPGGGFVLYPVDQLIADMPWAKVQMMLETWRELGDYPIQAT